MSKIGYHFIEIEARRKRSSVLHVTIFTKHITSTSATKENEDCEVFECNAHFSDQCACYGCCSWGCYSTRNGSNVTIVIFRQCLVEVETENRKRRKICVPFILSQRPFESRQSQVDSYDWECLAEFIMQSREGVKKRRKRTFQQNTQTSRIEYSTYPTSVCITYFILYENQSSLRQSLVTIVNVQINTCSSNITDKLIDNKLKDRRNNERNITKASDAVVLLQYTYKALSSQQ